MKTALSFLIFILPCAASLAQGKLQFSADTLHLVYYDASCGSLAGQPVSNTNMPAGVTLVADLYGGPTPDSIAFVTSAVFGANQGRWAPVNIIFPNLPGNTPAWFQVQVRDSAYANAQVASSAGSFAGFSEVFSATPASSISYPPIYRTNAGVNSTWQIGTFNLDAYGTGWRGEIPVARGTVTFPPSVVVTPSNLVVVVSGTATFHANAQGVPPIAYQWLYGTNVMVGETNSTLTLTNAQTTQSGQYRAVVSNVHGTTTSAPATLTVLSTLDVHMVPAIGLFGTAGQTYRIQWCNVGGSLTVWTDLATVTITNTGQLYFDLTAYGQPARYYRLVEGP